MCDLIVNGGNRLTFLGGSYIIYIYNIGVDYENYI